MSMAHPPEHAPSHAIGQAEQPWFTPAEVAGFQAEDRHMATAIVGLMVSIFVLGLIGYLGVCFWVG
jgi:hypothetical protein